MLLFPILIIVLFCMAWWSGASAKLPPKPRPPHAIPSAQSLRKVPDNGQDPK